MIAKKEVIYFANSLKQFVLSKKWIDQSRYKRSMCISTPPPPPTISEITTTDSEIEENYQDHRRIGRDQNLFFFNELSPGSCFFKPDGAHIYNTLVDFLYKEYRKRGLKIVKSPNIFNCRLWEASGHWDHFADDMFHLEGKERLSLKPMNCPGHCLIYKNSNVSWRDLPLRYAEFGVLHRNEASGNLTGLFRVRRFQQDDAHIFCTQDQISSEIAKTIDFIKFIYSQFAFKCEFSLSTRPQPYMGELSLWNEAETALRQVLENSGHEWKLKEGDGAFYGPKIDVTLTDSLLRPHQCATIQLDFQLPIKFDLTYNCQDGSKQRPVMIHRAILGSVERFMAIILENFKGNLPFWLSPRQIRIVSVAETFYDYACSVRDQLHEADLEVVLESDSGQTLSKKVKMAWENHYKFLFVVGQKESTNNSVTVRTMMTNQVYKEVPLDKVIKMMTNFKNERTPDELMVQELKKLNE